MLTYGFFNSKNNDRLYDATDFGSIFDGVINDGVYMGIGNHLAVSADGKSMKVTIGTGRAWFDHTWTLNTSAYELTIEQSELIQDRIDAVVLDVDHRENYRANSFMIVKGERSSNPQKPTLIKQEYHKQYPLAYIRIRSEATTLSQTDITNAIGTSECPFVTGIIQTITVDDLIRQWEVQWNQKLAAQEADFNTWFGGIKGKLDSDIAGHLTNEMSWMNVTVTLGNWSASTVANLGDGNSYYTYVIPCSNFYADVPQVELAPSGNNTVPTADETKSFSFITKPIGWVVADTEAKQIILYAKKKPISDFMIKIQGVS